MTIEQIVDIPADHRIHLDFEVPPGIPAGKARLTVTPLAESSKDISLLSLRGSCKDGGGGKLRLTRAEIDELMKDCPYTEALSGILSGLGDVDLDEVRMERLAKHLK
jgi:hypothetical protein